MKNLILHVKKKIVYLLAIQFMITTSVFSQAQNQKSQIGINLGSSFSTGNFGSTDFDESESAYAKNGISSEISFSYTFHPKIGLTALWRGQVNRIDIGNYAQDLANYFGAGYPAGTTSVNVETSGYSLRGMMAGIYGSFPILDKLSFQPRLLVGISTAILPEITTKSYYMKDLLTTFIQSRAETTTFSYIVGAGLKLDVSNSVSLLLHIDRCVARPNWENVKVTGIGHITGTVDVNNYDFEYTFTTNNIIGGLGFRF